MDSDDAGSGCELVQLSARRMPREQRRAQLLAAAATAFVRAGYDGTSVEEVADAAGVTRLIVYRIFGSKEELYRAVLDSVHGRLVAEFGDHEAGDFADRGGVAAVLLGVARERPDAFRLLFRHARHEPLFADEMQAFQDAAESYAEGLIRPYLHDDQLARWAAATLVAHLVDATLAWLDHGDELRDAEFASRMRVGTRALVDGWVDADA